MTDRRHLSMRSAAILKHHRRVIQKATRYDWATRNRAFRQSAGDQGGAATWRVLRSCNPGEKLLEVCYADKLRAIMEGDTYRLEGSQRLINEARLKEIGRYIGTMEAAFSKLNHSGSELFCQYRTYRRR